MLGTSSSTSTTTPSPSGNRILINCNLRELRIEWSQRASYRLGSSKEHVSYQFNNSPIVLADQEQGQDQGDIDRSVLLSGENRTLEQPETPSGERVNGVIERFTLEKHEDNEVRARVALRDCSFVRSFLIVSFLFVSFIIESSSTR